MAPWIDVSFTSAKTQPFPCLTSSVFFFSFPFPFLKAVQFCDTLPLDYARKLTLLNCVSFESLYPAMFCISWSQSPLLPPSVKTCHFLLFCKYLIVAEAWLEVIVKYCTEKLYVALLPHKIKYSSDWSLHFAVVEHP